jgi:hypothetical protein
MSRTGLGRFGLRALGLLVSLLPALAGCSCNSVTGANVAGLVTHKAGPVPGLIVYFYREGDQAYWGTTDDQGRFQLQGAGGETSIPKGTYTVWVNYDPQPTDPSAMIAAPIPPKEPPGLKQILAKYGTRQGTPLQITISRSVDDLILELD